MKERDVQNAIRAALGQRGIVLRLNVGRVRLADGRYFDTGLPVGVSDLLYIGPGRIAWIEVKGENGRLTPDQARFLARMRSLGHRAGVARSVDDAVKIIEEEIDSGV